MMKHKPAQLQIRSTAKTRMMAMTTVRFIVVDAAALVEESLGIYVYWRVVQRACMRGYLCGRVY